MAATYYDVKAGLDSIGDLIADTKKLATRAKAQITTAKNQLVGLPTQYSAILGQIDDWGTAGAADVAEEMAIAEKARLTTEFIALRNALAAAETDLAAYTQF